MHQLEIRNSTREGRERRTDIDGLLAAFCLIAPASAFAQLADATSAGPSAGQMDEVIVTARGVVENLQDVPISIVDFSRPQQNFQGVNTANDLARVAPGLSVVTT